jgi:hypothetical protein
MQRTHAKQIVLTLYAAVFVIVCALVLVKP